METQGAQLQEYRVGSVPTLYYVPDFISKEEEEHFASQIKTSKTAWKETKGRKVQNYGGVVEKGVLIKTPTPRWIQPLLQRLHEETGVYGSQKPNHVLVNAYAQGQGIFDHQDGPVYHPGVCILSLGGPATMHFKRVLPDGGIERDAAVSVLLQPRSLLIFSDQLYTESTHGITEASHDTMDETVANLELTRLQPGEVVKREGERISLTVRSVLKTRSNLLRL